MGGFYFLISEDPVTGLQKLKFQLVALTCTTRWQFQSLYEFPKW